MEFGKSEGKDKRSLELWKRYGKNIFQIYDYNDNVIVKAHGSWMVDIDGNEFLDFSNGQFCATIGHNNPVFIKRLQEQMEKTIHVGVHFLTPSVFEASSKLAKMTPNGLDKVVLLSTGTEANECAIKIAQAFTGKRGIAGFSEGYSGVSLATQSISSIRPGQEDSQHISGNFRILTPHCFRCPVNSRYPECDFQCLKVSEQRLGKNIKNIAAFIVEPVLSYGGVIVPPPGFFKRLKRMAEKHGVLLIVDEAQTGFGRTGKWFGIEHHEIVPDILVVSKAAGGGYPVSGVITNERIARKAIMQGLSHISSHQSDPLQGAALSAVIDIIKEDNLVYRANEMGAYLRDRLEELKSNYKSISDIRGIGLMQAIELTDNSKDIYSQDSIGSIFYEECKKKYLYLSYGSPTGMVFRIFPPLTVTKEEIDLAISIMDESLNVIEKGRMSKTGTSSNNPYSRSKIRKTMKEKLSVAFWKRIRRTFR